MPASSYEGSISTDRKASMSGSSSRAEMATPSPMLLAKLPSSSPFPPSAEARLISSTFAKSLTSGASSASGTAIGVPARAAGPVGSTAGGGGGGASSL